MTTDEIIKLAREADPFGEHGRLYQVAALTPETLARFATLIRNETVDLFVNEIGRELVE